MSTTRINRKKLALHLIAPEAISTLVGVIIGILKYGDDPGATILSSIIKWVLLVNAGAVAHQLAWLATLKVFRWKTSPTLKGIWRPTALGVSLTLLFIYLLHLHENPDGKAILQMILQVGAICIIVHIFMFQFNFYSFTHNLFNREEAEAVDAEERAPEVDYLPLKYDERIEKVDLKLVSYIKVEDHYCTVLYRKGDEWLYWTVYENLKSFEEQYDHRLVRINRSTLVNPQLVEKIEKTGGKHLITMMGEPDSSFSLSSSQKHLLEKLIPTIVK